MTGLLTAVLLGSAVLLLALRSRRTPMAAPEGAPVGEESGISDPALVLDLLGTLLTSGSSVEHALSTVAYSCEPRLSDRLERVGAARMLGASWDAAWAGGMLPPLSTGPRDRRRTRAATTRTTASLVEIRDGLRFATSTGAPSAALLHAHAGQLRRRHNREVDRRAAALGVQLVLPLGLCSLPAFICLGVVPVVLGLLPDLQLP